MVRLNRDSVIQSGALITFAYKDHLRFVKVSNSTPNIIEGTDYSRDGEFRRFSRSKISSSMELLGWIKEVQ